MKNAEQQTRDHVTYWISCFCFFLPLQATALKTIEWTGQLVGSSLDVFAKNCSSHLTHVAVEGGITPEQSPSMSLLLLLSNVRQGSLVFHTVGAI